ncbi:MAG: hypothetical protein PHG48_01540 [Eubacteriales bacterium]|nr:hypothetical protein [Eubacteriales bacterium]
MAERIAVKKNRYSDSVSLMSVSDKVKKAPGVINAEVAMATPANLEVLASLGFKLPEDIGANDLVIAVSALTDRQADEASAMAEDILDHKESPARGREGNVRQYSTLDQIDLDKDPYDLVQISLPGENASEEAEKAIKMGLDVFIFSDNVPLEEETRLKRLGLERGRLVMGPDCGVGLIRGTALAAGSIIRKGNAGIVGASGSGAQEIACIIEKCGSGVSSIIGTGGRDLYPGNDGLTMIAGMKKLDVDPVTSVIVLVSKLADNNVMGKVLEEADKLNKQVITVFLGGESTLYDGHNVKPALSLEAAALEAVRTMTGEMIEFGFSEQQIHELAQHEAKKIGKNRKYLRALYCGGTFAEESMIYLKSRGSSLKLFSNLKTAYAQKLGSHLKSEGHTVLDLGSEDFTNNAPHPVFDPAIRFGRFLKEMEDPETAVIVLDFITGPGVHEDPVTPFAEAIRKHKENNGGISFVTAVCGSEGDPQDVPAKERLLAEAGAVVAGSNFQSAKIAAAIIESLNRINETNRTDERDVSVPGYKERDLLLYKKAGPPRGIVSASCSQTEPVNDGSGTESDKNEDEGLRVINIGLRNFYDALRKQNVKAVHINWKPPVKQSGKIKEILDEFL